MPTIGKTSKRFGRQAWLAGHVAALALMGLGATSARAECPWIVQPHPDDAAKGGAQTLVSIVFDGLDEQRQFFYGFTVTDMDLAWDLATDGVLPDLGSKSRSLAAVKTPSGQAFELSDESIEPHAVYLVTSSARISELEQMEAEIEPSKPFHVSYFKTRGATDMSGPLPTRSLPGVEIRSSTQDSDVNRWLTLLENGIGNENNEQQGVPTREGHEKVLTLQATDPAFHEQGGNLDDHHVQICAYQVASR